MRTACASQYNACTFCTYWRMASPLSSQHLQISTNRMYSYNIIHMQYAMMLLAWYNAARTMKLYDADACNSTGHSDGKQIVCMQHAADTADTEEKRRMYYNMILCFTFSFASTNSDMGIFFLRCAASALWWWWWCKCAERVSSVLYLQYWLVTTFIARNQHEFYCVLICCNMNILDVGYCLWTHLCWLDAKETM